MKKNYHIGIIGAGLSGLSLARTLIEKNINDLIVIEKENIIKNDKTYSFWSGPGLFDIKRSFKSKPKKEWNQIEIKIFGDSYIIELEKYTYVCYESNKIIQELTNFTLNAGVKIKRGFVINSIDKFQNLWQVKSPKGDKINLKYVADSRPKKVFNVKYPSLKQVFIGSEVISSKNLFNPNIVTLMDFLKFKNDIVFTYILPYSKNKALIETTSFSQKIDFTALQKIHKSTLAQYSIKKILRSEKAVLPMSPFVEKSKHASFFNIGNFGGASRPASGYAFTKIALWANNLKLNEKFSYEKINHHPNRFLNWLDKIFLSVLRSSPQDAPFVFKALFTNVPIGSVIRFLSDQPCFKDYLLIILYLPKRIMFKGLINIYVR